jgi:[ribosomal protein S18]-alanine N-acetyltransferase
LSPNVIKLVEGSPDDLPAVMQVMRNSFDPAFGEAWTESQCAGLLPMSGVWLLLARDGDDVVGFALARSVLREAELLLLAVHKDRQGQGIGRLLLEEFASSARRRQADHLHLEVRDGNHALAMYGQAGFAPVGRRANYYAGPDGRSYDAITLARELN